MHGERSTLSFEEGSRMSWQFTVLSFTPNLSFTPKMRSLRR
jgi:hypothetical protein